MGTRVIVLASDPYRRHKPFTMLGVLKKLSLGLGLIALAAAVLLLSDLDSRRQRSPASLPAATFQPSVNDQAESPQPLH